MGHFQLFLKSGSREHAAYILHSERSSAAICLIANSHSNQKLACGTVEARPITPGGSIEGVDFDDLQRAICDYNGERIYF